MTKTILITGATGFLGTTLCCSLEKNGYHILKLGKKPDNDIRVDLSGENIKLSIAGDIDYVVHAAGKAHIVPKSEAEAKEFYDVNFEGTQNLCNALMSLPVPPKSFIFISTVAVYGRDEGDLIAETHPLNGTTPYAKSKILAEEWLQNWAKVNNIKLGILRLPLVAGPHPPGNLGAMIKGIRSRKYLSIGNAAARKSVVWAGDIAGIIPNLAITGGVFNLADGCNPSFSELEAHIAEALKVNKVRKIPFAMAKFIAMIGNLLGKSAPINTDKLKKLTSTLTFDDSRARKLLNWNPTPVLDKIPEMI